MHTTIITLLTVLMVLACGCCVYLFRKNKKLQSSLERATNSRRGKRKNTSQLSPEDQELFKRIKSAIRTQLHQPYIDLKEIAEQAQTTRSKIYSVIQHTTRKSVSEFILQQRLQVAKELLSQQELSTAEVIKLIGIKNQSFFIRNYRKEFKQLPNTSPAPQNTSKSTQDD